MIPTSYDTARKPSGEQCCDAFRGMAVAVQLRRVVGKPGCRKRRVEAAGRGGVDERIRADAYRVTHSVFARRVTHGTPSQYASFWSPPESVTTHAAEATSASISR